ncbi:MULTISPECIES: AMP-binding protein [unclassified Chelatococcus]|uniref:class I adenylate-forming enzyme family protein n=1 Tax=unclassified Chelatococcus TaxID=2638111 RepID=UPI001BCAEB8C|nr:MULTISPECIES: AMP-binding protein [unclassified Chelatococcus]MBS7698554.1 AMP-binding protein [Chelatococcus sp. YT9]MBX3554795.1 AMP-binding protein [Chelatococcus sp.]
MSTLTLGKLVESAARSRGSHDAYVELDRRRTWNEIHQRTDALGWALKEIGVRRGDRVGIISKDAIEVAESIIACAKIGAIRVGLNFRLAGPEITALIDDAGVDVVLVQAALVDAILPAIRATKRRPQAVGMAGQHALEHDYEALVSKGATRGPLEQTPHDTLMICYTTGSTGLPKGAIYPHAKMMESMAAIALSEGAVPDDVWFHAMPAAGIPIMHLLRNVFHGSKCAILGEWNAERALTLIEKERCSITVLVPTMLSDLLASGLIPRFDCSSLRQLGYGSSTLPPSTLRDAMKAFGCSFLQMYGSTELMGMAMMMTASDHEMALKSGHPCLASAGRPLFYVETKIVDDDGQEVPVGNDGELLIKTDYVTPGYWNQNLNYVETVRDGWLHTGDIAMRDADGFIYMKDRAKFRIKSGGYNIFPTEIENCLAEHPAISEVAVFGVPDPKWGDRIVAVVSLLPGQSAEPDAFREFCRGKIANFKVPKQVFIWDELPKGPTGKIQKRAIIDRCIELESQANEACDP